MIIGIKDVFKMIGVFIITVCAVFVCALFLNFNMDMAEVKSLVSQQVMALYNAKIMTGKVVSGVCGGCLLMTSAVMLIFYIKHYIDSNRKELGILKAMGYSDIKISLDFWMFGLVVLIGSAVGLAGGYAYMPVFYDMQNANGMFPDVSIHFHFLLALYLVIIPAFFFMIMSILYGYKKVKEPVLDLIKDRNKIKIKGYRCNKELPFLVELRKSTVRQRKSLVFFIAFAAFCFSAMVQMSFGIRDYADKMLIYMILSIGLLLAIVILLIAVTTITNSNRKTVAMMHTLGYAWKECGKTIFGGYRLWAYLGFVIGTGYQYGLLQVLINIVFKDFDGIKAVEFDFSAFSITLAIFVVCYELMVYVYTGKLKKVSIKEIMTE